MPVRAFPKWEVFMYLACLLAPIASLWLIPDWTWLVAVLAFTIQARTKVPVFLSTGELLICVSSFLSLSIWLVRLLMTYLAVK